MKDYPELDNSNDLLHIIQVVFCILTAMSAAGTVHRVSATTCLLFSVAMTWSLNKISQDTYGGVQSAPAPTQHKKKK